MYTVLLLVIDRLRHIPVVLIVDHKPDGRDFQILFQRDKDNNITGMTIQAKVYITGENASKDRAADLNKMAKDIYKSQTINGVKVSFDINYEYSKDITAADLGKGTATFIHPGYENDLMSGGRNTSLDKSHYFYYIYQLWRNAKSQYNKCKSRI